MTLQLPGARDSHSGAKQNSSPPPSSHATQSTPWTSRQSDIAFIPSHQTAINNVKRDEFSSTRRDVAGTSTHASVPYNSHSFNNNVGTLSNDFATHNSHSLDSNVGTVSNDAWPKHHNSHLSATSNATAASTNAWANATAPTVAVNATASKTPGDYETVFTNAKAGVCVCACVRVYHKVSMCVGVCSVCVSLYTCIHIHMGQYSNTL
jgi:hypothetical protein